MPFRPSSGASLSNSNRVAEPVLGPISGRSSALGRHSSRVLTSNDLLGEVLGSYRLVELIGSGGMGEVFRAEHIKLGREVAFKLLRPECAHRPESVTRFFQEARAVNRVRHRNIVDVTDLDTLEDGTPYIIMELLDGENLRDWVDDHHHETQRVLDLFVQICDGLSAAHQVEIIHRDLKPDNIMVVTDHSDNDLIKILDFGIAKLLSHEDEEYGWKTTEGFVMGTPAYMSPEQAGGMNIDTRSDLYSLGAIMYETFTGEPVFTGKSAGEYVRKHLNEVPVRPTRIPGSENLDLRIETVIMRCLAKEPSDRYATAVGLRRDLERILAGEAISEAGETLPMRQTGRDSIDSGLARSRSASSSENHHSARGRVSQRMA
ncbi:MAG: serine/threonine-protein kinase, partial [Myxococcota bacterium]